MPTDLQLVYAAGLIDGEGSVCLRKTGRWRRPQISAGSTTPKLLEALKATFGGNIYPAANGTPQKPMFRWILNGDAAIVALQQLLPFLQEPDKARRAQLLLFEYPTVYASRDPDAQTAFEVRFFDRD